MFSRPLLTGIALGGVATGTYLNSDKIKAKIELVTEKENVIIDANGLFPRQQWDSNWDQRDPLSLVDKKKYDHADEATKKEMLEKHRPTATRHIFLIRHGQYHQEADVKALTDLGREQALLLGERLNKNGIKYDRCIMSTMTRATETATLMLTKMDKDLPRSSDSMLEEGAPYPPEPPLSSWRPSQKKFFTQGARIEAAFRKHIHRASPNQKEDSQELIVCHANVIRYFICRALQFPREGWLRMSLPNTSITWLVVRPNGAVSVRGFGDIGHLPQEKLTFS